MNRLAVTLDVRIRRFLRDDEKVAAKSGLLGEKKGERMKKCWSRRREGHLSLRCMQTVGARATPLRWFRVGLPARHQTA